MKFINTLLILIFGIAGLVTLNLDKLTGGSAKVEPVAVQAIPNNQPPVVQVAQNPQPAQQSPVLQDNSSQAQQGQLPVNNQNGVPQQQQRPQPEWENSPDMCFDSSTTNCFRVTCKGTGLYNSPNPTGIEISLAEKRATQKALDIVIIAEKTAKTSEAEFGEIEIAGSKPENQEQVQLNKAFSTMSSEGILVGWMPVGGGLTRSGNGKFVLMGRSCNTQKMVDQLANGSSGVTIKNHNLDAQKNNTSYQKPADDF